MVLSGLPKSAVFMSKGCISPYSSSKRDRTEEENLCASEVEGFAFGARKDAKGCFYDRFGKLQSLGMSYDGQRRKRFCGGRYSFRKNTKNI